MDVSLVEHDAADQAADDRVIECSGYLSPQEAASVYAMLTDFVIPSSHLYLPCTALQDCASLERFLPQALATFVLAHLERLIDIVPKEIRQSTHGFEVWTTCVGRCGEARIYLHIDCDEKLRTSAGKLRVPLIGSVLYLGPGTGLAGGETAFMLDERLSTSFAPFQFHDWRAFASLGAGMRAITPSPGKLALFAGHLVHGQAPVESHPKDAPRIVLLANLWDGRIGHVPEDICRLQPAAFQSLARA